MSVRVLHSFPLKIGASRICSTAWYEVTGAADAGAEVSVIAGVVHRPLPETIKVSTTLARGRWRIPYSVLGSMRAFDLHDRIVARQLPRLANGIDLVHTWPLAARHTLKAARRLGIPTVLERPNANTRFAMEIVAAEAERLGVELPPDHEHAFNEEKLRIEEEEYALADRLLCPSEFVARTFADRGFTPDQMVRHTYGYDETTFYPPREPRDPHAGLNALFVGVCAVRKGVHFALEAWLHSPASRTGTFRIAGEFLPAYERRLAEMLAHPSVEVLGHRNDVPELMRQADVLMLPSIEEGYPLTCVEAIGSGCVALVSDACTDACVSGVNGFSHQVGDVDALTHQLTLLDSDRELLARLRAECLRGAPDLTWTAAGRTLVGAYEQVVAERRPAPATLRAVS
jgi:glycosyltransferase involved in cell wall biosynthesis